MWLGFILRYTEGRITRQCESSSMKFKCRVFLLVIPEMANGVTVSVVDDVGLAPRRIT